MPSRICCFVGYTRGIYLQRSVNAILCAAYFSHQECRFLFNSYVGAVWVQHGAETVQNWITKLVRPDWDDRDPTLESGPAGYSADPPPKRVKNESVYVNTSLGQIQTPVLPPRFSSLPPFLIPSIATSAPSSSTRNTPSSPPNQSISIPPAPAPAPASSRPNPLFLPMFNQAAAQRKVKVEYQTSFHGPPHAGKWHAFCIGETPIPQFHSLTLLVIIMQ